MAFQYRPSKNIIKFLKINCVIIIVTFLLWPSEKRNVNFSSNRPSSARILPHKLPHQRGTSTSNQSSYSPSDIFSKYYVYTSQCKVPAVDPLSKDCIENFIPTDDHDCRNNTEDLVTSNFNENRRNYILHINYEVAEKLLYNFNVSKAATFRCCYKEITRPIYENSESLPDNRIKILSCIDFDQDFNVPVHMLGLMVECYIGEHKDGKILQKSGFAFIQKPDFLVPKRSTKNQKRKPGVLIIGIDAVSRMNFRRSMPKTLEYLNEGGWLEMQGYNKIGDNTFPNLMAFLSGYNDESGMKYCKPKEIGGLDNCSFIWKHFKRSGYVTAFAEDMCYLSTFNYCKSGFLNPPCDFYFRPVGCALEEHLQPSTFDCVGRLRYADYVFNYCAELSQRYSGDNENIFGLCWANSFSHNDDRWVSSYDVRMREYFRTLTGTGALKRNIILFLSDHGVRYGRLLTYPAGYMEERLPMFFIWIPRWFRNEYPELYQNLKINQHRLSSPYDVYMTFKHILELVSDNNDERTPIPLPYECPQCQSLLLPIAENRTCADAGIVDHYCACYPFVVFKDPQFAKNLTHLIIDKMNEYIDLRNVTDICEQIILTDMTLSERRLETGEDSISSIKSQYSDVHSYRIKYVTNSGPIKAEFQCTFKYFSGNNSIELNVETISRLDSYEETAVCTNDKQLMKYCLCKDALTSTSMSPTDSISNVSEPA